MKARQDSPKPIVLHDVLDLYDTQADKSAKYVAYLIPQHNLNKILGTTF